MEGFNITDILGDTADKLKGVGSSIYKYTHKSESNNNDIKNKILENNNKKINNDNDMDIKNKNNITEKIDINGLPDPDMYDPFSKGLGSNEKRERGIHKINVMNTVKKIEQDEGKVAAGMYYDDFNIYTSKPKGYWKQFETQQIINAAEDTSDFYDRYVRAIKRGEHDKANKYLEHARKAEETRNFLMKKIDPNVFSNIHR